MVRGGGLKLTDSQHAQSKGTGKGDRRLPQYDLACGALPILGQLNQDEADFLSNTWRHGADSDKTWHTYRDAVRNTVLKAADRQMGAIRESITVGQGWTDERLRRELENFPSSTEAISQLPTDKFTKQQQLALCWELRAPCRLNEQAKKDAMAIQLKLCFTELVLALTVAMLRSCLLLQNSTGAISSGADC